MIYQFHRSPLTEIKYKLRKIVCSTFEYLFTHNIQYPLTATRIHPPEPDDTVAAGNLKLCTSAEDSFFLNMIFKRCFENEIIRTLVDGSVIGKPG